MAVDDFVIDRSKLSLEGGLDVLEKLIDDIVFPDFDMVFLRPVFDGGGNLDVKGKNDGVACRG